jgi:probable HAF family extracellular repeat protein
VRLSIFIVILAVGGLFYYPEQVSYTFTLIDVPFPGAFGTTAVGINDHGQIVGTYAGPGAGVFLYENGVFTPIQASSPCAFSVLPHGINAGGQIVGHCSDSSGTLHGFLYDKGVFTFIDAPFGPFSTEAHGINARGQIVGTYSAGTGGFLYDKGVFTRIDVPFPNAFATAANGINDHGQIVGHYIDRGGTGSHSFLYDQGVFTPINVPGAIDTHAMGINAHGQIVGTYSNREWARESRPHNFLFLYDKRVFTPIDLPFPDADYRGVSGINNHGQFVGDYYKDSGPAPARAHSFLATPHKKGWLWAPFLAVLLLAALGFLVLSRVRLGMTPAKAASGEPSVTEPAPRARVAERTEPPGRSARLVRQSPIDAIPQEIVFDREELLIGSGTECDLILCHPSIAPQHARATWHPQGYVLRAVHGVTQSTLVNGRPIGENLLKEGWVVRLGEVEFIFLCG